MLLSMSLFVCRVNTTTKIVISVKMPTIAGMKPATQSVNPTERKNRRFVLAQE